MDRILSKIDDHSTLYFYFILFIFRCINSLFVQTYFNPDEFWQSIEVAHKLVFGIGYLTWEWDIGREIRGWAHPFFFAIFYKIIDFFHLDYSFVISMGPRFYQSLAIAVGDLFLYKLSIRLFNKKTAQWILFCGLANWFALYSYPRTFSNSIETVLTVISLYYWPFEGLQYNIWYSLFFAVLAALIRPTNVIIFIFLFIYQFFIRSNYSLIKPVIFFSILFITVSISLDSILYAKLTFVPLNFFLFNSVYGVSELYGVNSFHYFISEAIPVMLLSFLPFFIGGFYLMSSYRELKWLIVWTLIAYSTNKHKEYRFILPLLPIMFIFCGYFLRFLQISFSKRKKLFNLLIWFIIISNILTMFYFSLIHQRAPLSATKFLSSQNANSVDFLTDCHSTPFYTHFHYHEFPKLRILECAPKFYGKILLTGDTASERLIILFFLCSNRSLFFKNPMYFVQSFYETIENRTRSLSVSIFFFLIKFFINFLCSFFLTFIASSFCRLSYYDCIKDYRCNWQIHSQNCSSIIPINGNYSIQWGGYINDKIYNFPYESMDSELNNAYKSLQKKKLPQYILIFDNDVDYIIPFLIHNHYQEVFIKIQPSNLLYI